MTKTQLTDKQLKEFRAEFLIDEMSPLTDTEKTTIYHTTDRAVIEKNLLNEIKHVATKEQIQKHYGDKYDHLLN